MGGILSATLGESPADAAARIEEAKKTATDLTGLVRRKAKPEASTPEPDTNGTNGKRKAEDGTRKTYPRAELPFFLQDLKDWEYSQEQCANEPVVGDGDAKKAKVEDAVDE